MTDSLQFRAIANTVKSTSSRFKSDRAAMEDKTRLKVLNWAYECYYHAKGVSGQVFTITDAKSELKDQGLGGSEVSRAVQFLVETGYLTEESRPFRTKGGFLVPGTIKYRISHLGIAKIEGESTFKRPEPLAGLKLTNLGNITVMHDGNVVDIRFAPIYGPLDSLETAIRDAENLTDSEKRDGLAEIRTIKGQMGKSEPDRETTSRAWSHLKSLAQTVAKAAPYVEVADTLLRTILK